jgi:hypothetical protein
VKITKRQLRKVIREYFARHTVGEDYVSPEEREERAAEELGWLMSKVFVGDRLGVDALRKFEDKIKRKRPLDVIYIMYNWGHENDEDVETFAERALENLGETPEPGGEFSGQSELRELLYQIL